jgi:phosphatidylglycerophosphate synthase
MDRYQGASRRPIAAIFRLTGHGAVALCLRLGVHPDLISLSSLAAAAAAAGCFWQAQAAPSLLLVGAGLIAIRLWLNMLDGMVALASGKASRRGEIFNELPDRFSDVLIFVGIAHSGLCHVVSGYWAAIAALITAYVGALGQAVGTRREFGGVMSKPWRMAATMMGAGVTWWLLLRGDGRIAWMGLTALDWTCLIIVLGCVQTIWLRLARIFRSLRELEREPPQ